MATAVRERAAGAAEPTTRELCLPTAAASAATVRNMVREISINRGAAPEWTEELVLAVSEAFSNAVRHGTGAPSEATVVTVEADADGIIVELQYRGEPFDTTLRNLPGDSYQYSGRGRYLMHQLLDGESFLFSDGMTTLRMFKHY